MYTDRPVITLESSVDMDADLCVSLMAAMPGKVEYTAPGTVPYGRTNRPCLQGRGIAVVPLRTAIMEEFVAGAAVKEGDVLEVGIGGKVIKQATGIGFAIARHSAGADKIVTAMLTEPKKVATSSKN